jgi:hypothetical protein
VVIHRKVTGGFRSDWGAEGHARFTSVVQTAHKQGQAILPTLLQILAHYSVPMPEVVTENESTTANRCNIRRVT